MALAPRSSSLRSLIRLMPHGKPRLSSFLSSKAAPPPGNCTPAAPALPDSSSHKCPDHEEFVPRLLHGDPCGAAKHVADKPLLYPVHEDPKYPTPDDGSCSTIPDPRLKPSEDVNHRFPDPPRRP